MKNRILFLTVLVFFAMATMSYANNIGIKGGIHSPIGDYGDMADMGFTIGAQTVFPVNEKISWGVNLAYATADLSDLDGDVTAFELYPFVNIYASRSETADFFLRGGLGFAFWEVDADFFGYSYSDDGTDVMFSLGAGANFVQNWEALILFNKVGGDADIEFITFTIGYNFDL